MQLFLTGIGWGSFKCGPNSLNIPGKKSGTSYGCDDINAHIPKTPACLNLTLPLFSLFADAILLKSRFFNLVLALILYFV